MKDTPYEAGTGAQPSEPGDLPNACVEGTPPNGAPRVGLGRGWAELPAGRIEGALKPRGRLPSPAAPPPGWEFILWVTETKKRPPSRVK